MSGNIERIEILNVKNAQNITDMIEEESED